MANMILGGVTFSWNPSGMVVLTPKLYCSQVLTYSGVEFFSWGASIVGVNIDIEWNYMPADQFDSINTLYQAAASIVWNPQLGDAKTYNVMITNFRGKYFIELTSSSSIRRKDVVLSLLIMSQV